MGQNLALLKVTPIGSNALFSTDELLIHKDKQEYIIGRGPGVDLEINFREEGPTVSRKHLRFEVMDDNSVLISHNSSARATYLNGVRIAKSKKHTFPIYPGDTIYLTDHPRKPESVKPVVALRIQTPEPIQSSLIGRFTHSVNQEFAIGDSGVSRCGSSLLELEDLSRFLQKESDYLNEIGEDASKEMFYEEQYSRLFQNISRLTTNELKVAKSLYQSTTKHGSRYGHEPKPTLKVRFSAQELAALTGYTQTKETDTEEIEALLTETDWNLKIIKQLDAVHEKLFSNSDLDLDQEHNSKFQSSTIKEVYETIEKNMANGQNAETAFQKAEANYTAENSYDKYGKRFDKNDDDNSSDKKKMRNAAAAIIRTLRLKLDRSYEYRVWEDKGKINKRRKRVTKQDFLIKEESGEYFMERVHDFQDFNEANGIW